MDKVYPSCTETLLSQSHEQDYSLAYALAFL